MAALVLLPLFWLAYSAFVDAKGAPTLENFRVLFTDAGMRKAFLLSLGMALGVGAASCAVATPLAWLVARTDMPGRRIARALVTASFVTPPFLGAIAWEMLAALTAGSSIRFIATCSACRLTPPSSTFTR